MWTNLYRGFRYTISMSKCRVLDGPSQKNALFARFCSKIQPLEEIRMNDYDYRRVRLFVGGVCVRQLHAGSSPPLPRVRSAGSWGNRLFLAYSGRWRPLLVSTARSIRPWRARGRSMRIYPIANRIPIGRLVSRDGSPFVDGGGLGKVGLRRRRCFGDERLKTSRKW